MPHGRYRIQTGRHGERTDHTAGHSAIPTSISNQDWLIHFSGVGIVDLKGNNSNDWRREMLVYFPNITLPLNRAISFYRIPVPTSSVGRVVAQIQVLEEMVASYAAISSAFEKPSGGADFGFAVDRWWTMTLRPAST